MNLDPHLALERHSLLQLRQEDLTKQATDLREEWERHWQKAEMII